MALLQRITDLQPNAVIFSGELDSEFNNLVNVLNGTDQTKSIRVRSNDGSFAVARFDQLAGAGNIAEFFKSGVLVSAIENGGNLLISKANPQIKQVGAGKNWIIVVNGSGQLVIGEELISNAITIDHTTGIVTFQAQPVLPRPKINWSMTADFIQDPTGMTLGQEDQPWMVVPPSAQGFAITRVQCRRTGGAHTGGTTISFTVRVRGSINTDLGSVSFSDANNAAFTLYSTNLGTSLVAGDVFTIIVTGSGVIAERNMSVFICGERQLNV